MCAGARTSTANGRVGAERIHYQVCVTQIYTVLTSKHFAETRHSPSYLFIFTNVVLCAAPLPVSYRYHRFSLLCCPLLISILLRAPWGTAPHVVLMKNRHSVLYPSPTPSFPLYAPLLIVA
jgi:hypothetical protein